MDINRLRDYATSTVEQVDPQQAAQQQQVLRAATAASVPQGPEAGAEVDA
jgi:hypothetical protein